MKDVIQLYVPAEVREQFRLAKKFAGVTGTKLFQHWLEEYCERNKAEIEALKKAEAQV